jgi:erythromycin esterase
LDQYSRDGLNGFAHYLTIPKEADASTTWTHAPVIVNDTFIDLSNSNKLVPAKHFDALLLIERVSPPVPLDP